jgi:hypothetical protein
MSDIRLLERHSVESLDVEMAKVMLGKSNVTISEC